jgi:TP901-1 family phage major tail protein
MTVQKGKDLLLKVDSDGAGSFTTVAGLRARTLAFNAATVDVTDAESTGRWRELLAGAGLKTARISGSGIFKHASSDETLRSYFFNGTVRNWQVIVPELGTVEGPFQIASLEYAGQHDGERRRRKSPTSPMQRCAASGHSAHASHPLLAE